MEQNTPRFRLRLNLFDGIILILAAAAGVFLLWNALKPEPAAEDPASNLSTVRYTVQFRRWPEGTSSLIHAGDKLEDNIKNYQIGQVVDVQPTPSQTLVLDSAARAYVLASTPGYEDVLVTVEAPASMAEDAVVLDGGYQLRVDSIAYIRGEGYLASGPIVAIEREGQG